MGDHFYQPRQSCNQINILQAKCMELEMQLQELRQEKVNQEEEIFEKNRKINYLLNENNDLEEDLKALRVFKERFDEILEERVVEQLNSIALKESTRLKITLNELDEKEEELRRKDILIRQAEHNLNYYRDCHKREIEELKKRQEVALLCVDNEVIKARREAEVGIAAAKRESEESIIKLTQIIKDLNIEKDELFKKLTTREQESARLYRIIEEQIKQIEELEKGKMYLTKTLRGELNDQTISDINEVDFPRISEASYSIAGWHSLSKNIGNQSPLARDFPHVDEKNGERDKEEEDEEEEEKKFLRLSRKPPPFKNLQSHNNEDFQNLESELQEARKVDIDSGWFMENTEGLGFGGNFMFGPMSSDRIIDRALALNKEPAEPDKKIFHIQNDAGLAENFGNFEDSYASQTQVSQNISDSSAIIEQLEHERDCYLRENQLILQENKLNHRLPPIEELDEEKNKSELKENNDIPLKRRRNKHFNRPTGHSRSPFVPLTMFGVYALKFFSRNYV
jgi:hypothetical protein